MAALKRSALGRGLDALITMDDLKTGGSSSISEIELSKIQPNPEQPRSVFEEETLEELATSIRSLGVIQPITLKEIGPEQYMIISGERRYRASLKAGLERIPAYIKTAADENVVEMALIENIQREDLNSIEIALAYQKLIDNYGLTQEGLSEACYDRQLPSFVETSRRDPSRIEGQEDRYGTCPGIDPGG